LRGGYSNDPPRHPLELPNGMTMSLVPPPRVPTITVSRPPAAGKTWDHGSQ
jgi:hypothetical protein